MHIILTSNEYFAAFTEETRNKILSESYAKHQLEIQQEKDMSLTTDPSHPDLTRYTGPEAPAPQAKVYLVLSEEERAKGFIRPYRDAYIHIGIHPKYKLRPLDEDQKKKYGDDWAAYEEYPRSESDSDRGKFWTKDEVDKIDQGCQTVTTMGRALSETYARDPKFYGATYCVGCSAHFPVAQFVWKEDGERVGS